MSVHYDLHYRFEPRPSHRTDLQRGFMAEIADPAWFLGRQWQMGEHQGENAASPVVTRVTYARRPLQPAAGRPEALPGHRPPAPGESGPALTPAESAIEGEAEDWWTVGRRVRIGREAAAFVDGLSMLYSARRALRLPALPEPYADFRGGYDGRALYRAWRAGDLALDPALFAEVPGGRRDDHWDPAGLRYGQVEFPCEAEAPGGQPDAPGLAVRDHDGGEVEWWSVDAAGDWSAQVPEALRRQQEVQPARFSYPGAPQSRWWQIEDARVDIGGFPPDRSHFPSLLLLDLVLAHSDDWFTLALEAQIGDVVTLEELVVLDVFREEYSFSTHPQLKPPGDWSLFRIRDLDPASLVLWPAVPVPVTGEALEEIPLAVDEDANLMWAVEERAGGLRLSSLDLNPPQSPRMEPNPDLAAGGGPGYLYRPSTFVPYHWHPYVIQEVDGRRMFVQGRLVDYSAADAGQFRRLAPEPVGDLLRDPAPAEGGPVHQIDPAAVPTTGLRLDRRYVLARRTDGTPVLWVQRRRLPLFSPPANRLRFDVVEEGQ